MPKKRKQYRIKKGKGFGKTLGKVGKFLLKAIPTVAPLALAALGRKKRIRGRGYTGTPTFTYG